jgi:ABC-type enterobactin transport system permease subunit
LSDRMDKRTANPQTRLYVGSIAILVIGLCCALLIYLTAEDGSEGAARYVVVDGVTYSTSLANSKAYVHELRLYGGKAAVLFDEFGSWFAGLWQGKSLGFTVAWISIFVSAGVFLFARHLRSDSESGE